MKTAIVTGASGGIGFAAVAKLAADGFRVAAFGRRSAGELGGRFEKIEGEVRYFSRDIQTAQGREGALSDTLDAFGRVDALVNAAGVAPSVRADLLDMTEESFDRVVGINTRSTLFLTQIVAKAMLTQEPVMRRRGVIVNISSISAYATSLNRGEYCISKAGMSMVTSLFADRLAPEGIAVFEVRPGIIMTDMTSGVTAKYDAAIAAGTFPIARWGQPEDVAEAVSVLCADRLLYSTGDVINVDGGYHLRRF